MIKKICYQILSHLQKRKLNLTSHKINTLKDVKLIEKIKKYLKSNNLNFFILIESSMAIINLKEICTSSKY